VENTGGRCTLMVEEVYKGRELRGKRPMTDALDFASHTSNKCN
jgi:hypothetical protein